MTENNEQTTAYGCAFFVVEKSESETNMKFLWRYVLAWMGCLGIMNVYFCRINLSVAMVAMVGVEEVEGTNFTEDSSTCTSR